MSSLNALTSTVDACQTNPFDRAAIDTWLSLNCVDHDVSDIGDSEVSLPVVRKRGHTRWRMVGYDWLDYAPTPAMRSPSDLCQLVDRFFRHGKVPFRIDRALYLAPGRLKLDRRNLRSAQEDRYFQPTRPLPRHDQLRERLMRKFLKDNGGTILRVRPSAEIMALWRVQKHAWVLRHNKRFCLSQQRPYALFSGIAATGRGWLAISGDGLVAGVLIDPGTGPVLRYYLTSYDNRFARFSVSTMLLLSAWTDVNICGIDFMRGAEPYKRRYSSFSDSLVSIWSR